MARQEFDDLLKADHHQEARKNPEQYKDLMVRVVGYSAYFVDLSLAVQEDIISRTEHSL